MSADARSAYTAGREARAVDVKVAERRARAVGNVRVLLVLIALAFLVAHVWGPLGNEAWWGFAACVAVFSALVVVHARLSSAAERAAAALRFHVRGLQRLDDAWRELPNQGARFVDGTDAPDTQAPWRHGAEHPYADDLDVFGRASIFQRIDATETRFGEERLATWLAAACEPVDLGEVRERQAAVRDLASRLTFRERLSAAGAVVSEDPAKPDPGPFVHWAEGSRPLPNPAVLRAIAFVLPSLVIAGAIARWGFGQSPFWWMVPVGIELVVLRITSRHVGPIAGIVSAREGAFARYGEVLAALEAEPFEAPLLRAARDRLRASGADSTREMARLERILSFVEARNNEVWRFFVGPLLLWDLHCVLALERWRQRVGSQVRGWFETIGLVEALASLAGFAFEEPSHTFPMFADRPCFVAEGLGHPLLPSKVRVANDVTLAGPGCALVVTGSNMSGKSTLLRAMGANAVLGLAGAPTCAKRLTMGPLRVATSMRVRDSLSEGVSRFYAEVRKIKAVIERARASGGPGPGASFATLFLLDEVLHGTNSRERLIGARAIVRELIARGSIGAVSTHDLALGDMEGEEPQKIANVHFEEQVEGERMTFDYVLRPGVVTSSNALRIMRMVGIDVVMPE